MDWMFLACNEGASRGVLVMWECSMVEKLKEFVGEYIMAFSFKSVEDFFGLLLAYMGPI